jgi:putative ABC transport system substrate-binding protein
VFINPADAPRAEVLRSDLQAAARDIGVQLQILDPSTSREIDAAFGALVREQAEALFVCPDGFYNSRRVQLANMAAARHVIPTVFAVREYVEAGGLMSYGTICTARSASIAVVSSRVQSQPICQYCSRPSSSWLSNLQTARMLGLTVPDKLLAAANEVIE